MSDEETKIIENYETTTAIHDSNVCAELISDDTAEQTTELPADSGYFGEAVSQKVREKGVTPRIIQRRIRGQKKLTKWQEKRNKAITKRRCTIEHIFGAIKHFGGDIVRSIGLACCKIRHGLVFMLNNMKRFCFFEQNRTTVPGWHQIKEK